MSELRRMCAYYYSFNETGEEEIDILLSAIACAGKAYHHTEEWQDGCQPYEICHRGETPIERIQNAACDAANRISAEREARSVQQEAITELWTALSNARLLTPEEIDAILAKYKLKEEVLCITAEHPTR